MADLIALGAPALPTGYFYRVEGHDGALGISRLRVSVRRKRLLGSTLAGVSRKSADPGSPVTRADLLECARRAHDEAFPLDSWEPVRPFFGDHPGGAHD